MTEISQKFKQHYQEIFRKHGAVPRGVDWEDSDRADLRYEAMLGVISHDRHRSCGDLSILDVGCGYGGLLEFIKRTGRAGIKYTGIDLVTEMLEYARQKFPDGKFVEGDVLDLSLDYRYDYVLCNGLLTQKLAASIIEMDAFSSRLIEKLFESCRYGIAFNVMKSKVDFMNSANYYKNPLETIAEAMRITPRFVLNHAYPLYEYTVYMYK